MTELAINNPDFAEVSSFEEAFALMKQADFEPVVLNKFDLVEKDDLIGVPFIILDVAFRPGDYGPQGFVSVEAVTTENKFVVFNDGSTGIAKQLKDLRSSKGITGGIICRNGLRISNFYFNEKTGETSNKAQEGFAPASTYYLD